MALTPGTPFVVFGDDWGRFVSTIQHLFRRVVDQYPVIWVNSYGHRIPRLRLYDLRRAAEKLSAMLVAPTHRRTGAPAPGMPRTILQPRALPWHHVPLVHTLNTRSIVRDLRRTLAEVAPGRRPVLVTGTPVAEGVVGQLDEIASIYFCMDDYAEMPQVSAELVQPHEPVLLDRVDTLVATARVLLDKKRPRSGRAFQLPQGVNFEHFATSRPAPPEIASLPRPIIGFSGTLNACCDLALINRVAEAYPSASIVFVGMHLIDPAAIQRPNVHLLGARSYADLPPYVQAFDVGLIPYLLNDWTRAVDSLKLLEYLAAGIPVVTTDFPEVRKYGSEVSIAEDPAQFVALIGQALKQPAGRRAQRQQLASRHTWEHRAAEFLRIVETTALEREQGANAHDAQGAGI